MKNVSLVQPSPLGYKASNLPRSSSFRHLSQPLSAVPEPARCTAFAAPGASPGVLGMKGGVAGHLLTERITV